jgi:sugar phosphate isomerase/epimerase
MPWTCATRLTPPAAGALGIAVDIYHVWWDPKLEAQINRGRERQRLLAFHVCGLADADGRDLFNDRGMMGDGIDRTSRRFAGGWRPQGFAGFSEVEIFSSATLVAT